MIVLKLKDKNQYHAQIDLSPDSFSQKPLCAGSFTNLTRFRLTWEGRHNGWSLLSRPVGLWACLRGFYLHYRNWDEKTCSPYPCGWHGCLGRDLGLRGNSKAYMHLLFSATDWGCNVIIYFHFRPSWFPLYPETVNCTLKVWVIINHFPRSSFFRELYYSNRKKMVISLTL